MIVVDLFIEMRVAVSDDHWEEECTLLYSPFSGSTESDSAMTSRRAAPSLPPPSTR